MAAAAGTGLVLVGQLGRTHHTLDQFNSSLSLLLPVLAIALAGALRTRDWATVAVAAVGLAVGGFQLGGAALIGVLRDDGARGSGPVVKIATFSTFHANPDPAAIPPLLAAQRADVVLLQETNGTPGSVVGAMLPGFYRIQTCNKPRCASLTILSRWPVRRIPVTWAKPQWQPDVLIGEIRAPFGTFRVIDVHLPRPYAKAYRPALRGLAELAQASPAVPLVMAGDFNTATGGFGLAGFGSASGLRRHDAFIPTYPANELVPAFAGIDHVFANGGWSRMGCRRMAAAYSDHYGIACRMRLRE